MQNLKKLPVAILAIVFSFGFISPINVLAATTPSLGAASTYSVLSSTYTNTTAGTTLNGDVGFTTGPAVTPSGAHANYGSGAPYATAGSDQNTALSNLSSQGCTFNFGAGAINLSTDTTHGVAGVYAPGVYCSSGAMNVGGPLSLSGSGTFIFRPSGALTSTAGAAVTLSGGASACDVFWTPSQATTLAANTTFLGMVIDNSGITIGANSTWSGRALAFGGTVTTDTDTMSAPSCAAPVVVVTPPPASTIATLHIVKVVVNNNGGVAVASMFNIHVRSAGTDVTGSPALGLGAPGTSYSLAAGNYTVSEDGNASYAQSFSGACNASGLVTLTSGTDVTCTITNDDVAGAVSVPATITVIKVVVNDNGGTRTSASFPLFVGNTAVTSGVSTVFTPASYMVTETSDANYVRTFSGDCDANGLITILPGNNKICTITNNDVAATITPAPIVPTLPDTGYAPQEKSAPWNIIVPALGLGILLALYVARKKQII